MKVVILAGGYGTRISEESHLKPKPMIEIGSKPILWHIMKIYSHYGYNDFVICLGYKGYVIKEYFANYFLHESDVTFDFSDKNKMVIHNHHAEPWKVTLVNTGVETMTGGRLKRVKDFVGKETFMLTYGDGLSDIDIKELVAFHTKNKKMVTVTSTHPASRFGMLKLNHDSGQVLSFQEKSPDDAGWINGGFFVMEPQVFNYLKGDNMILEREPLETIANEGNLIAYKHDGFWQPMDTLREKNQLEEMWTSNKAPWKLWP